MNGKRLTFLFGGDLSVGYDSEKYIKGVAPMFKAADIRIAQLETPYCKESSEYVLEDRTTKVLEPLVGLFDLFTLSGNHFYDFGELGVRDTTDWLDEKGIAHAGGGINIDLASQPGFYVKNGVRFGVLAYNAVGPKSSFASKTKGGCAFVNYTRALIPIEEDTSRHENDIFDFKAPVYIEAKANQANFPDITSLIKMCDEIAALRKNCDVLSVYFHKGMVHKPALIADYERLICRLAVDAGADVIFATHSHLLRGCEIYKGKVIFHGLNNFVMWVPSLSPVYKGPTGKDTAYGNHKEWVKKRVERFGFVPDPDYPTYPFHPDSIYTICAKCIVENGIITESKYVPMIVDKEGVTRVVSRLNGGQAVFDYMEKITREAGLNAHYEWDGDDVRVFY